MTPLFPPVSRLKYAHADTPLQRAMRCCGGCYWRYVARDEIIVQILGSVLDGAPVLAEIAEKTLSSWGRMGRRVTTEYIENHLSYPQRNRSETDAKTV